MSTSDFLTRHVIYCIDQRACAGSIRGCAFLPSKRAVSTSPNLRDVHAVPPSRKLLSGPLLLSGRALRRSVSPHACPSDQTHSILLTAAKTRSTSVVCGPLNSDVLNSAECNMYKPACISTMAVSEDVLDSANTDVNEVNMHSTDM